MAGITTSDTIIDRVTALLAAYIDAEVDLIDTRNNTVAGGSSANSFTTPSIPSAAVQAYVDRQKGLQARIVVTDEGSWRLADFQVLGHEAHSGTTEPSSAHPRIDRTMRFGVSVRFAARGGAETTAGASSWEHARRACNRIADACVVILSRYPTLSIPSTSTAMLVPAGVRIVSDERAKEVDEDSALRWQRDILCEARTIESRA